MGRREIDRSRLKQRVLDTADVTLQTQGARGLSMSDFVKASGVSRRTFYKVFASREDLLKAVAERRIDATFARVREIVSNQVPTAVKVEAMLRLLQTVTSFGTPAMLSEIALNHPELWGFIDAKRMKMLLLWRDIIVEGQRRGEVRPDLDPDFFMHVITAVAQNVVTPAFLSQKGISLGDALGQFVNLMLHGALVKDVSAASRVGTRARAVRS